MKFSNLTFTTATVGFVIGLPPFFILNSSPSIILLPQLINSFSVLSEGTVDSSVASP